MKPSDYIRKGWTQGHCAIDATGNATDLYKSDAVSWCLFGALHVANTSQDGWDKLEKHLGGGIITWNDTPGRTQEEVIAALEAVGL